MKTAQHTLDILEQSDLFEMSGISKDMVDLQSGSYHGLEIDNVVLGNISSEVGDDLTCKSHRGIIIHHHRSTNDYEVVTISKVYGFVSSQRHIKQEQLVEYLKNTMA